MVELLKIWLTEASGHANTIISSLDGTEPLLAKGSTKFKKAFTSLFVRSCKLYEMLILT